MRLRRSHWLSGCTCHRHKLELEDFGVDPQIRPLTNLITTTVGQRLANTAVQQPLHKPSRPGVRSSACRQESIEVSHQAEPV